MIKKLIMLFVAIAFAEAPLKFKEIRGKKCAYIDIGEGYPLLLGHSFLWDAQMWRKQVDELSKKYRVIAVDLWAHGSSEMLDNFSLEGCAETYAELMAELGCEKYAVVGLSVGGMWGTYLALNHPENVEGLVLMGTYLGAEPEETQKAYLGLIDQLAIDGFTSEFIDSVVPYFFSPHTFTHNIGIVTRFKEDLLNVAEENVANICTIGRTIFTRENLLPRFKELEMPTLVIVGKDDSARVPSESEEMASLLPNGAIEKVENAGHISSLEQPEAVNTLLEQFLEKNVLGGHNMRQWTKSKLQDPSKV